MIQHWKIPLSAALGLALLASPALAQQAPPAKGDQGKKAPDQQTIELEIPFAVLDVQAILRKSVAVKDIRKQITTYGTEFEKEIEKERDAIRKANQELARQRTILAPDAFAEKRREFEQRVVEVQRLVQQRQRELDKSRNNAMIVVNKAYTEIVSKLAGERNFWVILRKNQTTFSVASLDITNEVLSRLDKQLPTVKVAKPGK
ncbi:MAG: OmpH family outer membrane protein [Rhodospirillales bacterium]